MILKLIKWLAWLFLICMVLRKITCRGWVAKGKGKQNRGKRRIDEARQREV